MIDTDGKGLLYVTKGRTPPYMIDKMQGILEYGLYCWYLYAYPGGAVYCATKAAVKMLSDGICNGLRLHRYEGYKPFNRGS